MAGFHWFGSSNWYDRNHVLDVGLGEQPSKRRWYPGTPPVELPDRRLLGNPNCLASGDNEDDAIDYNDCVDGIPKGCFLGQPRDKWPDCGTETHCSLQRFYARIIEWLYDDQPGLIQLAFENLLGAGVVVKVRSQVGNFPAIATVKLGNIFICVLDGTRTFQQLALQGLYSVSSPQDFGILETNPFWYQASAYVLGVMQDDGLAVGDRVMLAGHSYGAAVAAIIAARLKAWPGIHEVRFITYGCPKPGGVKLKAILSQIHGIHLATHNDIVTVLPPDQATLAPVLAVLPFPQLAVWTHWERPENQLCIFADGSTDPNNLPLLDMPTLAAIANDVLSFTALNPITGHRITEYYRRLTLRCPDPEWPVNPKTNDILYTYPIGLGGLAIPSGALGFRSPMVGSGFLALADIVRSRGHLALADALRRTGDLALQSPAVAQGELALLSPAVAQGELALLSPAVAQGELALLSPAEARGGALGLQSPEEAGGGALGPGE